MSLRHAVSVADLVAAANRLSLHGNPVELEYLTDEQFASFLASFGQGEDAKRIIANAINRPNPGRSTREEQGQSAPR